MDLADFLETVYNDTLYKDTLYKDPLYITAASLVFLLPLDRMVVRLLGLITGVAITFDTASMMAEIKGKEPSQTVRLQLWVHGLPSSSSTMSDWDFPGSLPTSSSLGM